MRKLTVSFLRLDEYPEDVSVFVHKGENVRHLHMTSTELEEFLWNIQINGWKVQPNMPMLTMKAIRCSISVTK